MKVLIPIFLLICSCNTTLKKKERPELGEKELNSSEYLLNFKRIDNLAKVYIQDSLIYSSPIVHGNPEIDYMIDFSEFIVDGSETLKIQLFNGKAPFDYQEDPHWEIRYYLIIKGEIVDFTHEIGDDNALGKVFEYTYTINEWSEP